MRLSGRLSLVLCAPLPSSTDVDHMFLHTFVVIEHVTEKHGPVIS